MRKGWLSLTDRVAPIRRNTHAGILLYAKTDEDITPDVMFNLGGNQIGAKTLDLNKDFALIAAQLDKIAEDYFGVKVV